MAPIKQGEAFARPNEKKLIKSFLQKEPAPLLHGARRTGTQGVRARLCLRHSGAQSIKAEPGSTTERSQIGSADVHVRRYHPVQRREETSRRRGKARGVAQRGAATPRKDLRWEWLHHCPGPVLMVFMCADSKRVLRRPLQPQLCFVLPLPPPPPAGPHST